MKQKEREKMKITIVQERKIFQFLDIYAYIFKKNTKYRNI